jgi:hypothetical protein
VTEFSWDRVPSADATDRNYNRRRRIRRAIIEAADRRIRDRRQADPPTLCLASDCKCDLIHKLGGDTLTLAP